MMNRSQSLRFLSRRRKRKDSFLNLSLSTDDEQVNHSFTSKLSLLNESRALNLPRNDSILSPIPMRDRKNMVNFEGDSETRMNDQIVKEILDIKKPKQQHVEQPAKNETDDDDVSLNFHNRMVHMDNFSLMNYLKSEVNREHYVENDNNDEYRERSERIYNVLRIPLKFERFTIYSYFQCVDTFLSIITYLPIRLLNLARSLGKNVMKSEPMRLTSPQLMDLLKTVMIIITTLILYQFDLNIVYHKIRVESTIKLYLLFNMLEIGDRLLCNVGQDILDTLFWFIRYEHFSTISFVFHFILTTFYVIIHSLIILVQTTTLQVAFHSYNSSLISILISNNFIEIKGSVFKKMDQVNLFKLAANDVRERFQMTLMFIIIILRSVMHGMSYESLTNLIYSMIFVVLLEFIVDWIKYAFVLKFNRIDSNIFLTFRYSLAQDIEEIKLYSVTSYCSIPPIDR
ncbi:hypothetical protein SNEBB_007378 [Seison nebaliae]|nr:hypothetical protein SNEBB_007378 [Seison nebaliae]